MSKIFICYRREDTQGTTGRIYDYLEREFGKGRVFKDVYSIEGGDDFLVAAERDISSCDVFLVAIGRQWLTIKDEETGQPRLQSGEDTLRKEIEFALDQKNKIIFPLLCDHAVMPGAKDLPDSIASLAMLNALDVRPDPDFPTDMQRVVRSIKRQMGSRGLLSPTWPRIRRLLLMGASATAAVILGVMFLRGQIGMSRRSPIEGTSVDTRLSSEMLLTDGVLTFSSEGIDLYWRTPLPDSAEADSSVLARLADRIIEVGSRSAESWEDSITGNEATLSFEIRNTSKTEAVTLSNLQINLLGLITAYEDQIPEPQAPYVRGAIEDLTIELDDPPRRDHADLKAVFGDDDTPNRDLLYSIVKNSDPRVATVNLNGLGMLTVIPTNTGKTEVHVRVTDPFGLFAETSFSIDVRDPIPLADEIFEIDFFDDVLTLERRFPESGLRGFRITLGDTNRVDLGIVLFRHGLSRTGVIAPCSSGDLLVPGKAHHLPPDMSQSFSARLECLAFVDQGALRSAQDAICGFEEPRRRLSAEPPNLLAGTYVFLVTVHANSTGGESGDLRTDRVYVVDFVSSDKAFEEQLTSPRTCLGRARGKMMTIDQFVSSYLETSLKTYIETLAYQRAVLCGAIPDDFDASATSAYCYFGDRNSPFRAERVESKQMSPDRWERTNLVNVLRLLREENPAAWKPIEDRIIQLASSGELPLRAKAAFVFESLNIPNPEFEIIHSRTIDYWR